MAVEVVSQSNPFVSWVCGGSLSDRFGADEIVKQTLSVLLYRHTDLLQVLEKNAMHNYLN
jgi:hypothetical protein